MASEKLSNKLESYRLLIFNSRDTQIAPLLNELGVNNAYLDKGEALYNQAMQSVDKQKKEYQDQNLAYDAFYVEKDEAESNYRRTRKLVKVLSRNDVDLQNRLGLQYGKVYAIEEWIDNGVDFYNRLLNDSTFLTTLAKFKVTANRIKEESKALTDLKTLRNPRKRASTRSHTPAQRKARRTSRLLHRAKSHCRNRIGKPTTIIREIGHLG